MADPFDAAEFQRIIDHDNHDTRRAMRELSKDPIFIPRYNVSLRYQREVALEQLKKIADQGLVSVKDFGTNPHNIFTMHELIGSINNSLSTKFTVQFNLFGGTVYALGTERHQYMLDKIDNLSAVGCFGLTEVGYGNNAVEMETTATWDPETKEWIINTPTTLSYKYWITNGAMHAHYCVVFAQTYINGNNEGIHAFLTRIRNDDLTTYDGVYIEDMGFKLECNGVDNAKLGFNNVRIPRENILNHYADMSEDGTYSSEIVKKRDRFLAVADRLLSGRICIASMTIGGMKKSMLATYRYATQRLCVGPKGKSDTPIADYQLFQNNVLPYLARLSVLMIGNNHVKDMYAAMTEETRMEVVRMCCGIKALVTWTSERAANIARERLGGAGYLMVNALPNAIGSAHAGITAEGDNAVLMQKIAKEILSGMQSGNYTQPSLSMCPARELPNRTDISNFDTQLEFLRAREVTLVNELTNNMTEKFGSGKPLFDIWMKEESDTIQHLSAAYCERVCFEAMQKTIQSSNTCKNIFTQMASLYALFIFKTHIGFFVTRGLMGMETAKLVEVEHNNAVKALSPSALKIVESFGLPETAVHTPIATGYQKYNEGTWYGEVPSARL